MTEIINNQAHEFELSLLDTNGDFDVSQTVTYEVRNTSTNALITSGTMSVQGDVYKFSYTFTSLGQFRVLYTTPTNFENGLETVTVVDALPDQIWDEALASHLTIGSTGKALDDADATADPTAVADAVWASNGSGVGRTLTEGTKDAEIDAIKAKTDNLPIDPASETNATSNKNSIIAEIDANEVKIDSIITDLTTHRTAVETKITYILGLSQHNTRIDSQVYDSNDQLLSAKLKLYNTASNAINDTNILKTYNLTATFDTEGKLTSYVVGEA